MPAMVAATLVFVVTVAALFVAFRDTPARDALAGGSPANDAFERRERWHLGDGTLTFPLTVNQSTDGATLESGEDAPCAPIGATVWFEYWGDRSGTLTIDTAGSDFPAVIAAYSNTGFVPSPPGDNLAPLGCDNADGGPASISFEIVRGQSYLIQVGGQNFTTGNLRLLASCACAAPNDDIEGLTGVYVDSFEPQTRWAVDTRLATLQPGEQRPCGDIGATVWFEIYFDFEQAIEIDTFGSDFDTVLALYTEDPSGQLAIEQRPATACNDDAAGGAQSRLRLDAPAGRYMLIQAGGAVGASGSLVLNIKCDPACRPQNDDLERRGYVEPPYAESIFTEAATLEPGEQRPCGNIGATVWQAIYVHGDARVVIDTAQSEFPTVIAVYAPIDEPTEVGALANIACDDGSGDSRARLEFDALGAREYLVQLGGRDGATGLLNYTVECDNVACPPYNDSMLQYNGLAAPDSLPYQTTQDSRGATTEAGEDLSCGSMGRTLWYSIYASESATPIIVSTDGSSFDTAIAVYEQQGYDSSVPRPRVACAAGGPGQRASVQLDVKPNTQYVFQIGGRGGTGGDLQFRADCVTPCPPRNDNIGNAGYLSHNSTDNRDTREATNQPGEMQPCGNIGKTVWYAFYPNIDYTEDDAVQTTISTLGSDFPTVIALYEFEGVSPPGGVQSTACSTTETLDFTARRDRSYMVQVGGVDGASGALQVLATCPVVCPQPRVDGIDTGGSSGTIGGTGVVYGPDTGSGGYLPGSRRH